MAVPLGSPRYGGRIKGSVNKSTKNLQEIADSLEVNPFEVLLRFAANDWEGLGYQSDCKTISSKGGEVIYVDNISATDRINAAKSACEYLYPKRKAIEMTGAEGKDLFQSFGQIAERVLKNRDAK